MLKLALKIVTLFRGRDRWVLGGLVFLIAASTVIEMAGIGLFLPLVSIILDPNAARELPVLRDALAAFAGGDVDTFARLFGLGVFVFFVGKNFALAGIAWTQNLFVQRKLAESARDLLESYLSRPYVFHLHRNSAELMRNVKVCAPQVFARGTLALLQLTMETMAVVGILGLLLYIDPAITVGLALLLGGSMAIYYWAIHSRMLVWSQRALAHNGRTFVWLNQALGAIKETKLSGRSRFFVDTFGEQALAQARYETLLVTTPQLPRMIIEAVAVGGAMFLIFVAFSPRGATTEALPVIGVFAAAAMRLMPALGRLMGSLTLFRSCMVAVDAIYDDLIHVAQLPRAAAPPPAIRLEKAIEVENVSFVYPDGRSALRDVSLSINAGESVALVGHSGAGKTTLVDIVLGLLEASSGRIRVDGRDIRGQVESWQRKIGYIPQTVYLIDDSIRRNIALGYRDGAIDETRLIAAVRLAHLDDVVAALPKGLDTEIGERGTRLSGGQRQRIAIARALYDDPDVLVMDEATAALDNETEREITRAINELSGRKTLIIIAHRLSTVKACDRLYFMQDGRIADAGPYDELLARNPDFRRMALDETRAADMPAPKAVP